MMLNIDFTVMGLDDNTSEFLNWCLKGRDNLEWIKEKEMMESVSTSVIIHFDDLKTIKKITRNITDIR